MATAMDPSALPPDTARLIQGMWPARLGKSNPVNIPKKLLHLTPRNVGEQIQGYAIYSCKQLLSHTTDLLVFTDRNLYIVPMWGNSQGAQLNNYLYYKYDLVPRGQRASLSLIKGAAGFQFAADSSFATSDWVDDQSARFINNIAYVQFDNELLFHAPNSGSPVNAMWRYYRDSLGVQHLYAMYIPAGGAPTISATGAGVLNGIYQYLWTWVDELGRESSPSLPVTTSTLANNNQTITRGSTTANTATAGIRFWKIYRRNPGSETYNFVTSVAVGTTTYVDNNSDAVVADGDAAPDDGENDPPDTATYLAIHKNRVVLNDADTFGVVQIGNAGSATQYSSITLPTNTTSGIRIDVGDDADNVVTGIESIGDLLWLAKPSSYYLLQGDNITNWNLQQVGKNRGCDNPFTVQRTEAEIMFKSDDGMYGLTYQWGMVSPKNSWEIDDLFSGFVGMLTPNEAQPFGGVYTPATTDGNTGGQPISAEVGSRYIDFVRSAYWQNRYFLCLTDRTIVFDMLSKGWGDTNLGPIKWPIVYSGSQPLNITGSPYASLPETMIFSHGGSYSGDLDVWYFTAADTPFDIDLGTTYPRPFVGREVTRSFSEGTVTQGRRRGKFFCVFGQTGLKRGALLGHLQAFADNRKIGGPLPLRAYDTVRRQGALCEVGLPEDMVGQNLFVELTWQTGDIEVTEKIMDFISLT